MPAHKVSPARDVIQVAFAADAEFAMPLGVAIASLARTHAREAIAVTILHDGLSAADISRVERTGAGRVPITWHLVNPSDVAGAFYTECLTSATLYRLLLPHLMPSTLDRVLYLDCDLVVTDSLRQLWTTDLHGKLIAAARDANSPFPVGPAGTNWRGLGLRPNTPYFNAGVLLIPLDAWRAEAIPELTLGMLRTSRPRWGDQDVLNAALQGRWLELPRRWNLQTSDVAERGLAWALWADDVQGALADPAILHFTERDKPWHPGSAHPLRGRWYQALDDSAWSGWRPGSALRPVHRRVGSRVKLAWRALTAGRAGLAPGGLTP
jgi:lipopolysaccharide biosynthesis glycosyltransferase